jgi:DNA repair exonuclease SbcCD nuclease subunit
MAKCVRLLCYSDEHYHQYTSGITLQDIVDIEYKIYDIANDAENDVDMILNLGDRFTSRNPLYEVKLAADQCLFSLNSLDIPIYMLIGNHQYLYKGMYKSHTQQHIQHIQNLHYNAPLDNITIIDTPCSIQYSIADGNSNLTSINLIADPAGYKPTNASLTFDTKSDFNIYMFHDTVIGSKYANGIPAEKGIDKSIFDLKNLDLVLGGDNHTPQDLNLVNTQGIYVGSPITHTWGDANSKRGIWIIDLYKNDDGSTGRELNFIEFTSPRFIKEDITINSLDEFTNFMINIKERWNNNVVKLIISGPSEVLNTIKPANIQESIKTKTKARSVKIMLNHNENENAVTQLATTNAKDEWISYIELQKAELTDVDIKRIENLGIEYILEED